MIISGETTMNGIAKSASQHFLRLPDSNDTCSSSGSHSANMNGVVGWSKAYKLPWKIVVLGDAGVGKSCLIKRFINGHFSPLYNPTVEDCYIHNIDTSDGQTHSVEIFDTSGYYQFPAMRELNIRVGTAFLLVFDLSNEKSLLNLFYLREIIVNIKKSENVPLVLIGNKVDTCCEDAELSRRAASIANDHFKCTFIKSSAKNDTNVSDVFTSVVELILRKIEELECSCPQMKRSSSQVSFLRTRNLSQSINMLNDVRLSISHCDILGPAANTTGTLNASKGKETIVQQNSAIFKNKKLSKCRIS